MLLRNFFLQIVFFIHVSTNCQDINLANVVNAFQQARIPESLNLTFQPTILLEVTYPQVDGRLITVSAGERLDKAATLSSPSYRMIGQAGEGPFVIIMIDPDAPTPQDPIFSEIRHFMGGDFRLIDPRDPFLLVSSTEAVTFYHEPRPIRSSDQHRYIFLLYHQPNDFNNQTLITPTSSIAFFEVDSFMRDISLGQPIGGTFMYVGPDESSPVENILNF